MKRTIILNEDDLIMVVAQPLAQQIDEHRGEMTRTEFVSFLLQSQLNQRKNQNYITAEEFHRSLQDMKGMMHDFMEFVLSLDLTRKSADDGLTDWLRKVKTLESADGADAP
ncbi:MAG: hypothetical protein ABID87_03300 [Chloroflexota bacterium]